MPSKSVHSDWRQHWCVPPIRWLQRFFVPPLTDDWARVSFQPMLYLGTFIGTLMVLVFGDFTNLPAHPGIQEDRDYGVFWIWMSLSLIAPPMALGSLWLIRNRDGPQRYRGKWLRLAADIFQFTGMLIYVVLRLAWGDFHIIPVAVLISATLFVAHLIMRDVRDLVHNERIAIRLHRNGHGVQ